MPLVDHSPGMRGFQDPDERRELIAKLMTAIGSGVPVAVAADYAGIGVQTLRRWIRDGARLNAIAEAVAEDDDDDRVPDRFEHELMSLHDRVAKQEADAEKNLTGVVWNAATNNGDVKSAQWMLERRWPQRWARRTEITGAGGGPLEIEETTDRRQKALEGLDKLAGEIEATEAALANGDGGDVVELGSGGDVVDGELVEVGDDQEAAG